MTGDTIDSRQQEETSNGGLIVNDGWHMTNRRQLQFSGYRFYTLGVRANSHSSRMGPRVAPTPLRRIAARD